MRRLPLFDKPVSHSIQSAAPAPAPTTGSGTSSWQVRSDGRAATCRASPTATAISSNASDRSHSRERVRWCRRRGRDARPPAASCAARRSRFRRCSSLRRTRLTERRCGDRGAGATDRAARLGAEAAACGCSTRCASGSTTSPAPPTPPLPPPRRWPPAPASARITPISSSAAARSRHSGPLCRRISVDRNGVARVSGEPRLGRGFRPGSRLGRLRCRQPHLPDRSLYPRPASGSTTGRPRPCAACGAARGGNLVGARCKVSQAGSDQ